MPGIYSRQHGLLHPCFSAASTKHRGLSHLSSFGAVSQRRFGSENSGRTSAASSQRSNDSSQGSHRSSMSIPRNSRNLDFLSSPRMSFDNGRRRRRSPPESSCGIAPISSDSGADEWGYFVDCDHTDLYEEVTPSMQQINRIIGSTTIPEAPQEGIILEL